MAAAVGGKVVTTFAYSSPVTTGSLDATTNTGSLFIAVFYTANGDTVGSVTDNKGNTYSLLTSIVDTNNGNKMWIYVKENGSGGAGHTVTVTMSGGGCVLVAGIEITGVPTSSTADGAAVTSFDTSTPFNNSITTTNANDLVLGFAGVISGAGSSTFTANGSFTKFLENIATWQLACASLSVSATGSYDPAWTQSGFSYAALITIAVKSSAGGGSVFFRAVGVPFSFAGTGGMAGD